MECDKCGGEVDPKNDAVNLDYILTRNIALIGASSRHLLPIKGEQGKLVCEGSLSRAQYIMEVNHDTRGYPYIPELAPKYQEAWKKLQKEF